VFLRSQTIKTIITSLTWYNRQQSTDLCSGFSSSTGQHRENYDDWIVFHVLQYTHHSLKHLMDHQLLGRLNLR